MVNNNLHTLNITLLQIIIKNCREVIFLYYKKVEITGLNTASLPVLNDSDREALILKMKNGDKKAKEKLVMANLKLILSIIQKINIKNAEPDDLFQVGCIGLIKALNNFDPINSLNRAITIPTFKSVAINCPSNTFILIPPFLVFFYHALFFSQ